MFGEMIQTGVVPSTTGPYILKNTRTGELVVRELRDDGHFYTERGEQLIHKSEWMKYYSWFVQVQPVEMSV